MSAKKGLALLVLLLTGAACAGRQIYRPIGCEDRLGSPYKRAECLACVERPVPHPRRMGSGLRQRRSQR